MQPPRRDSRAGSASLAYLLLLPVIVLLLFGGVQVSVRYAAHEAAVAAARAAADQARLMPPGDGQAAALAVTRQGNLLDPTVTINRGAETVTVTVTGKAPNVLWSNTVHGSVTYPVERAS